MMVFDTKISSITQLHSAEKYDMIQKMPAEVDL